MHSENLKLKKWVLSLHVKINYITVCNNTVWSRSQYSQDEVCSDIQMNVLPHKEHLYVSCKHQPVMFRVIITVYCYIHKEHINTVCGQHAEVHNVKSW